MITRWLEVSQVYLAWQGMFSQAKIAPLLNFLGSSGVDLRVLDLGCGPGTNASAFSEMEYTGVDVNPHYIEHARARYRGTFICADAISYQTDPAVSYDLILVNSLMHHLTDPQCVDLMENSMKLLAPGGVIHILDAIDSSSFSLKWVLARLDRGKYFRGREDWADLIGKMIFQEYYYEYDLNLIGIPAYRMFYLVGRPKS